jgi:hypothetical protein
LVLFFKKEQSFFLKKEAKTFFRLCGGIYAGGEDTPGDVALEVQGNQPVGFGFTLS